MIIYDVLYFYVKYTFLVLVLPSWDLMAVFIAIIDILSWLIWSCFWGLIAYRSEVLH